MEKINTRDLKLQIIRAYLEKRITPEEIEKKYAINRTTIEEWINIFFNEAGRFFENENFIKDIDCKLKTMSETLIEKEKIISCLERDNYELKKIIYTFEDEND